MKIGVLAFKRQPSKKVARQVKISREDCKQMGHPAECTRRVTGKTKEKQDK